MSSSLKSIYVPHPLLFFTFHSLSAGVEAAPVVSLLKLLLFSSLFQSYIVAQSKC